MSKKPRILFLKLVMLLHCNTAWCQIWPKNISLNLFLKPVLFVCLLDSKKEGNLSYLRLYAIFVLVLFIHYFDYPPYPNLDRPAGALDRVCVFVCGGGLSFNSG